MIETDIDPQTRGGVAKYLPSPAEIVEACRLIRANWSPEEEQRRRVIQPTRELDYGRPARIGTN